MPRVLSILLCLWSSIPFAQAETQHFSPEQLRADFHQLRSTLYASHVDPFAERSQEALDAAFNQMLADIAAPMSRGQAALHFQRWVALGDVAHARVEDAALLFSDHMEADGLIVPFDVRIVKGQMYISVIYAGAEALQLGDRILSINGHEAETLRQRLHAELSADNEYLADTLIEFQFTRVLWQLLGTQDRFTVRIERGDQTMTMELAALRPSLARSLGDEAQLQLSWVDREARMAECNTAYLRPGPFYNPDGEMWDTSAFHTFIDGAMTGFLSDEAERLLIDLRNNPGGDSAFSDHLLAWIADRPFRFYSRFEVRNSAAARASNALRLEAGGGGGVSESYAQAFEAHDEGSLFDFEMDPVAPRDGERFEGEVFVLINRHSYSNAVNVAAMIQDYGFGTIVGEPTSDLATTLGAMEHFTLTNTGLRIGFPKARIIRPSGDLRRIGVQPDRLIATPVIETTEDPVLLEAMDTVCRQDS